MEISKDGLTPMHAGRSQDEMNFINLGWTPDEVKSLLRTWEVEKQTSWLFEIKIQFKKILNLVCLFQCI